MSFLRNSYKLLPMFTVIFLACGGATPPASIPAPVSGLVSVTSPDESGEVVVSASAGAFQASALVTVTNTTQSVSATDNAEADGSLVGIRIAADVGDSLEIDGGGDAITVMVPAGIFPLDNDGVAAAGLPTAVTGIVGETDGTDTFLHFYLLVGTASEIGSSPLTYTNFVLTDSDWSDGSGDGCLIDNTNASTLVSDSSGTAEGTFAVTSPQTCVASQTDDFFVIGQEDGTDSLQLIDNETNGSPALDSTFTITHSTDGTAIHVRTIALSVDETAGGSPRIAALSVFDNGDTTFSLITSTTTPGAALVLDSQVNLGSGTFDSVALFNSATEALVTDTANDQVIHLSGVGFATQQTITVGDAPMGIAYDETNSEAYVANSGANTVSIIDVSTDAVIDTLTTTDGVGLNPLDISVVINGALSVQVIVIANGIGEATSIVGI